jgi:hypothetical protein
VESHNVLWPFISRTTGPGIEKLRVFPFYGYAEKEAEWLKRFVLWPFWTSVRHTAPDRRGFGFVLFPLCGHARVGTDTESWMVLPPFFRFSRKGDHAECHAPWPVFQYASGDYEKLYVWPVWGRKSKGPIDSWFFLWPVMRGERIVRSSYTAQRFLFLPFVQHETRVAPPAARDPDEPAGEGETAGARPSYRYLKLWPLFNYRRREQRMEFRLLALWPFKNARSIERNYSPLWTLYERTANEAGKEDRFLWGLFRWRRDEAGNRAVTVFPLFSEKKTCDAETTKEWKILLGLAGCKREGSRKTYRLLYFLKWQRGSDDDADP